MTDKDCAGNRTSGRDPRLIRSPNEPNGRDLKFQLSCFYQTQPTTPHHLELLLVLLLSSLFGSHTELYRWQALGVSARATDFCRTRRR